MAMAVTMPLEIVPLLISPSAHPATCLTLLMEAGQGQAEKGGGGARYHHTKSMTHYQQPCRQGWSLPVLKLFCAKFQPEV